MTFDFTKLNEELRFGARELAAEYGVEEGAGTIVSHRQSDRLSVHREGDTVTIGASTKSEFSAGLLRRSREKLASRDRRFPISH